MLNTALLDAAKILLENDEDVTRLNYGYKLESTILILEDANSPVTRKYQEDLFKSLLDKAHIDFGDIPKSKGNIRDYSGYGPMIEVLNSITNLAKDSKALDVLSYVKIVTDAIDNIANLSAIYERGFTTRTEYVALEYDVYTYMCVQATSALLYNFVDFMKDPTRDVMKINIKNTKLRADEFYFENLKKFNSIISTNGINYRKMLEEMCNKGRNNAIGAGFVVGLAAISTVALSIVPVTRACLYQIYHLRSSLADSLELQAKYLELNKSSIENNQNFTDKKKKEVIENQKKAANNLRKLADKVRVKSIKSITDSKRAIQNDNKSFSTTDGIKGDINNEPFEIL